jgi:ATP synthase protein I
MPAPRDAKVDPGLADSERGLSSVAAAYRRAEPYLAASNTLMASVAAFTAIGYGLDRWLGHTVQWLLITGSVIGIAVGFFGFFRQVLRANARTPAPPRKRRARAPSAAASSGSTSASGRRA